MSKFSFSKPNSLPSEPVNNFYCARNGCNNYGTIAHTTSAGPETKWFCGKHAFEDRGSVLPDAKSRIEKLSAYFVGGCDEF